MKYLKCSQLQLKQTLQTITEVPAPLKYSPYMLERLSTHAFTPSEAVSLLEVVAMATVGGT